MKTKNIVVYDNGGESLDRYTVFPYLKSKDDYERRMYIGISEGGHGVSMWGEVSFSDLDNLDFLGTKISFNKLSKETQNHIIARLAEWI